MTTQKLKTVLTVKDIQEILQVGSHTAYNLIHSRVFPVRKVGHSYRVPTEPFNNWLSGQKDQPNAGAELQTNLRSTNIRGG